MIDELERDVRISVLLGGYVRAWGIPSKRTTAKKDSETVDVYEFPATANTKVNRYASVGVSALRRESGASADWELCIVLPSDNGGASAEEVIAFLLDVMSYSLRSDVQFSVGSTIAPSSLMPVEWRARALLVDEPRGEPAWLANVHVGVQHIKLLWLIPIHADERELILAHGIGAFDDFEAASDWSLADPNRPSCLLRAL